MHIIPKEEAVIYHLPSLMRCDNCATTLVPPSLIIKFVVILQMYICMNGNKTQIITKNPSNWVETRSKIGEEN